MEAITEALLERERERQLLSAALDTAQSGAGTVALIAGSAGLGKSRLLETARREALGRGFRVASASGDPLTRDFAFGLALRLIEPLVRAADGRLPPLSGPASLALPLLDPQPGRAAPASDVFPFVRGLHWLVVGLAERTPLFLAVDDVQWSDVPSLRFLVHLAQRIADAPIALVAAQRTGEPDVPAALLAELEACASTRLLPAPLSSAAVGEIVAARFTGAEPEFARGCFEATGGNPFLLLQLLAEVEDREMSATTKGARELIELAPPGVLRAVAGRLERLPDGPRQTARAAAVLGDGLLDEAAALTGMDLGTVAASADELARAALMEPGERLRFVHPLLRSSVYADIAPARRGLMHLEAARMLHARHADPEKVAGHLVVAHRTADPWAVERLREAARSARAAGAPASAVTYLRRALEEPPAAAGRAALLLELGSAEAAAGDPAAVEHIEQAVELTPPGPGRAALRLELGQVLYERGRMSDAAAAFDRGLAEADGADERLRLQLEAGWMTVARLDASLRGEATRRFERLSAAAQFGSTSGERALLANVANQMVFTAEPRDRALELAHRALAGGALLDEEGAAGMTWILAAGTIGWADELVECAVLGEAGVADARERGSVYGFAQAVYLRSFPAYYRGDLANAQADLELAIAARDDGWEQFLDAAIGQHAWVLVERDQAVEAERALTPAIERSRGFEGPMLALMLEARARARLAQGTSRAALEDALEAGRLMTDSLIPNPAILPWRGSAAIASSRLGEHERAVALAEEEVRIARRFGAPRVIGMALRGAGIAYGGERGVGLLREAVGVLERSPARLELARALTDLGAALRREREAVAAREPLVRGLGMARELGALALERRAGEELAAAGGARPRRDALSGRESLTPSELRIATMAAEGLANREIAQALFLTMRTVETHLTHSYRKLGIASRSALAEALRGG